MNGYIKHDLLELEHILCDNRHHTAPSNAVTKQFGNVIQYAHDNDSDPVNETQIKYIKRVVGKLFYFARAINITMQHALNNAATTMSKGTTQTLQVLQKLLDVPVK